MSKNPFDELKEITSKFEKDLFDFNGESFLNLEKKVARNDSYSRFVLFVSQYFATNRNGITLRQIRQGIQLEYEYLQKIIDFFVVQNLILKNKIRGKNFFMLNHEPESIKLFVQLVKIARGKNL